MPFKSAEELYSMPSLPPLMVVCGEEEFLVDELVHRLTEKAMREGADEYDTDMLAGETLGAQDFLSRANSYPFTATRRLVLVKNADAFFSRNKAADTVERLSAFFSRAPETSIVIFASSKPGLAQVCGAGKASKGKTTSADLSTILDKFAAVVTFKKMYDRDIHSWLAKRGDSLNVRLSGDAIGFLTLRYGDSLRSLAVQVEKVLTAVFPRTDIGLDDVVNASGGTRDFTVFDLQKKVGERNLRDALLIAEHLVRTEKQEVLVIATLSRYFTSLFRLDSSLLNSSPGDMARALGVSPYFASEYVSAYKRFTRANIEDAVLALCSVDHELKSSSKDPLLLIQDMLVTIIA